MTTVFDIDDIVGYILSFVPRHLIGSCLLVNKKFHNAINIDKNYKNAVKNGDMFSFPKIMYSPIDALHIAKKYKHKKIIEYLIKYKKKILKIRGYTNDILEIIGYMGDEDLYKFFCSSSYYDELGQKMGQCDIGLCLPPYIIGLCGGGHYELVEKYKCHANLGRSLVKIIINAYKRDDSTAISKATELCKYYNHYDLCASDNKFTGIFSRQNISCDELWEVIDGYALTKSLVLAVCRGLYEGGHCELFKWFINQDRIKKLGYDCYHVYELNIFVMSDDYKFFSHIFLNYKKKSEMTDGEIYIYGMIGLSCIDYRRLDMLLLLLKHIKFDDIYKNEFIYRCDYWGYDDLKKIIIEYEKIDI